MTLAYSYDRLGNEDGEPNGKAHRQEAIPAVNLNSTDNVSLVPLSGGATPEPIKLYNRGQPDLVDPRTGDAGGNAEPAQAELLDEDALVASAGLTTRINGSDGHGIMPKSKDRPLVTAATIIRPDQPRPHSYIASTGYISASNSSMPSPSISRHSSTASSANTAHSALYNNIQPANTIPNGAGNGSTSANGQASSHAYHRLSLGYPQRSPLSSAASSPDIASSPASQFSSEISTASSPNINRVVSGTSSNGTTIPSSPRSRRKPVPPLNLPILSARELPPMHPFASAQSSPRDPPVKMSTSQTRSGSGVSGGAGREGSSTPTFPPGSARSLGRGISVGGSGSNHSSEPGTPGFMEDKDLFFKPPKTSPMTATTPSIPVLGPVPPRRSPSARLGHGRVPSSSASSSPVAAPQAAINPAEQTTLAEVVKDEVERLQETEATSSDRRGTFHNGLNIHIPAPPAETTEQDVRRLSVGVVGNGTVEVAPPQEVEALRRQSGVGSGPATPRARYEGSPAFDTPSPTNTSPFPPNHEYLNRSLPSLPANASKTSLGMFSILQTGPQNGSNGSPTLAGAERNDRMASVDSTMTGLTSIATPKDMGRSTTTLDMFSALESGPDGRKYSATPLVGNQVYGAVGSTPQLKAYSPSLQTTDDKGISGPNNRSRKKSGRLGFFSHSSSRKSRGIPQTSAPGSIPEEDGEHDGGALSRQRTKKGETESDDEGFSVSRPPSKRKMFEAGQTYIRDERGNMIRFADLFPVVNGDSEGEVPTITKAELQAQVEGEIWKRRGSLSSLPSILHERDGSGTPTSATTPTQAPSAVPGMRSIPSNIATPPSSSRPSTMSNGRESGTYSRNVSGVSGASASPFAFNLTASNGSTSPYNTTHTITTQDIDLRTDRPQPKTVVFFIRTFYCGQCQDYTLASIAHIDPEALKRHNIRLVVISNGNWRHIKPYRELFKCPYPIYVDASRKLYRHMGMTKSTINPGPFFGEKRAAYNQNSVPRQWMQSMTTAVKLPKRNPGNLFQLGGEFILGPGYECIFAHRMTNFSNHMEASDVFRIAGIDDPLLADAQAVQLDEAQKVEADRLQKEMEDWRAKREATLETMARKKASRMGQPYVPPSQASRIMLGLDDPDDVDMAALQDSEDEDEVPHREAAARPRPAVTTGITENAAPNGNATIAPEGPDNYEGLDVAVANHSGQSDGPASEPMSAAPSADQPREEKPGQAGDREIGGKTAMELATIAHPIDKSTHPTDSTGSERGLGISAGDEHTGSASAISSAVSFPTAKAPADQEVERELSLAEKYEELMKKYEALKVEHDRRSSVAV